MSTEPEIPFAALFEQSPNRTAILEPSGRYVAANRAYRTTTGCEWDTLCAEAERGVFDAGTVDDVRRSFERVLRTGRADAVTGRPARAREVGARRWAIAHAPLRGASGEIQWILQHLADVTELEEEGPASFPRVVDVVQRTNEALLEQKDRLLRLFADAPGFMCVLHGPDHVIELANPELVALVGPRELEGRPVREAIGEAVPQGFVALLDGVYRSGQPFATRGTRAYVLRPPERRREEIVVDFVFHPVLDDRGAVEGVFVAGHDVTAHHVAMSALAAREREHQFLTEMLPTQVWTSAPDGAITWVNRATSEYRGLPATDLLGDAMWRGAVHPDDLAEAAAAWQHALDTGQTYENESRLLRHDGVYRWHMTRAVAWRDARGAISKWYGSTTDVEEHKRMESQRDQRIALLRSRNFELQRFAYAVTHDVKAPLRAITNLADWIAEDLGAGATPEVAASLDAMRTRAGELSLLLDGMLRDAVAGRAGGEPSVDTGALVRETVTLLAPGASLRVEIAEDLPTVVASVGGLRQVFLDLLGNAISHGARGGWIRIDHTLDGAYHRFFVRDRGVGIEEAERARLWGSVTTGAAVRGLPAVRRIVEANGGSVSIETTPGGGATFSFTWPREHG